MRSIGAGLASTRLAFVLIGVLLVMIVVSAVIPQRGIADGQIVDWRATLGERYALIERAGLDRIYFSYPFFLVLSLLAVNLAAGNVRRFRTVWRVERTLLKARHVGSIVFHISLLLIIGGVVLNYLYKFHGVFGLTEGQTAHDDPADYFRVLEGPLFRDTYDRFEISVEKVHEIYEIGGADTEAAEISVRASAESVSERETMRINRPFAWRGLEFHLGARIGYSPELFVVDADGRRLFRGFVRLKTHDTEGPAVFEDFLLLPEENVRVHLSVLPDPTAGRAPERHVSVERGEDLLFRGAVAPGDTVEAADLRVGVPRVRRWCYVEVVESPFLGLVFAGFWTALAGLAISALARISRREWRAA
jgi:cytochrome c biogenesis protein ResB